MNKICQIALIRITWALVVGIFPLASITGSTATASAATLDGRVVGVTDGDTIKLLLDGRQQYKIRLGEIDAPESGQPFGQSSKRMLSDLVFGKTVRVRVTGTDSYGRSVGVITAGSTNINAEMVKRGGAWAYRRYLSDQRYILWENEARQAKRGLWRLQPDQIMAPWEWRTAKRSGRSVSSATRTLYPTAGAISSIVATSQESPGRCGVKWKCSQMTSCAEAVYQLRTCGLGRLDGDGDGVPCEKICG